MSSVSRATSLSLGVFRWMPVCTQCREDLVAEDFKADLARPNGLQSRCKRCLRRLTREAQRRLRQSPEYRRAEVEHQNEAYRVDPEFRRRKLARTRARHALERGTIHRCPCRCGNPDAEIHLADYSRPLEVVWLCRSCRLLLCYGPDRMSAVETAEDPIADVLKRLDFRRVLRATG